MQSGSPAYVRDGITFEGGPFGGDIEEAVQGNPDAEDAARSFKARLIGGFCGVLGGTASFIGGTALAVDGTSRHTQAGDSQATMGAAFMLGGLAAYFVGVAFIASAPPKLYDAVNIYNDGVDTRSLPPGTLVAVPIGPTRAAESSPAAPAATTPVAPATPPLPAPPPAPAATPAAPAH
jgi:hypothetical protein